jgi:hypothetical protein
VRADAGERVARHFSAALVEHVRRCRRDHLPVPDGFLDLAAMLATARQCPPSVDGSPSDVDAPVMPPASLDYATAGAVLPNWQAIQCREPNGSLVVGYDTGSPYVEPPWRYDRSDEPLMPRVDDDYLTWLCESGAQPRVHGSSRWSVCVGRRDPCQVPATSAGVR